MNKFLEEFKGVAFGLMNPEEIEKYVDYELNGNSKAYTHEELWAIRDRRDNKTEENKICRIPHTKNNYFLSSSWIEVQKKT